MTVQNDSEARGGTLTQTPGTGAPAPKPTPNATRRDEHEESAEMTPNATAVRMIWTSDHLDVVRRLQAAIIPPARATAPRPAPNAIRR